MENRAGKFATLAAASVAFVGATAVIEPASASFSPSTRIFESRERAKNPLPEIPLPAGARPASPMPYAGGDFGEDPMDTLVMKETPPPAPQRINETPSPELRQSFSALTSFDESVEMTSGDRQASNTARTFPPSPAQWNNPIQWISTHHQ